MIKMIKRTGHWAFLCLLCSVFCFSSYAQGVQVERSQLTTISSSIKQSLAFLKSESESLNQELQTCRDELAEQQKLLEQAESDLKISNEELDLLHQKLTNCVSSLSSMNSKYNALYTKYVQMGERLKIHRTINIVFSIILGICFIYKIIAIVLRCRGIKLPWILDLLF